MKYKVTVEMQERFTKNPKSYTYDVTFKKMLRMIADCHHPLDARTLELIRAGEPGFYFVTDRNYEYRINIEKPKGDAK